MTQIIYLYFIMLQHVEIEKKKQPSNVKCFLKGQFFDRLLSKTISYELNMFNHETFLRKEKRVKTNSKSTSAVIPQGKCERRW